MTERAGVRGEAKNVTNEVDAFKLFITDGMITELAEKTKKLEEERINLQAAAGTSMQQGHHLYNPVTHDEMSAFLGLNILRCFYSDLTVPQLFNPITGPSVFKATMGGRRFSVNAVSGSIPC